MEQINGLSAVLETITPAKAKQLLDKNKLNRPINDRNLNGIIAAIKADDFHITGESIKVAKNGNLIDGQHRLMAVIQTGISIKTLVTRGVDNDAFKYLDTGRSRKPSDVLGIEGYKNPARLAALAAFVMNFKKGYYFKAASGDRKGGSKGIANVITNADVSGFVYKNKESMLESIGFGYNPDNKLLTANTMASFHYIFKGLNQKDADDFCYKVMIGEGVIKDTPAYHLRQRMVSDLRSTKKMKRLEKVALICKAWNLYRQDKKITILKWESLREPFPKPI